MTLFAQKTIFGIISDSSGNIIEGVFVRTPDFQDSTITNELGEYKIIVADTCQTLVYSFEDLTLIEDINKRNIINISLPLILASKKLLSMNPRIDYPLGLQLTLAGHSLFAVSVNYFLNEKQSFELGVCGRGLILGARRYFPLNDYGRNSAFYTGIIFNLPIDSDFIIYVPFGYQILSHNGMAFSIELGGKTPPFQGQDLGLFDFLGFGINFGFQINPRPYNKSHF